MRLAAETRRFASATASPHGHCADGIPSPGNFSFLEPVIAFKYTSLVSVWL